MGDCIYVFNDIKQLNSTVLKEEMVVQQYLDSPLLLDGLKFDLRLYVVVTGINEGEVHAFLADEGLARFCTKPYQKPTKSNFKDYYMHLTNYSVNKGSDTFIKDTDVEDIMDINNASKRTLSAIFRQIERDYGKENPQVLQTIKENIEDTISKSLALLVNKI
mmetsp:Transcript_14421/g.24600  ORF Transcript_14421/g.24600 Transcript_14421/m.24600 type:complete len:162 (+) Transcript_14421:588-1073(+)